MSKVLALIEKLSQQLDSNWEEELSAINIWEDFAPLYHKFSADRYKANVILAFLVFAYDRESKRIDLHMDRMQSKSKILCALAGLSAMADADYTDAAVGLASPYNELIEFYINYQKDRRWRDIVSNYDYHSKASAMASIASGPKEMEYVGKMLKQASILRNDADQLVAQLEQENVVLDAALKKENRVKLSDRRGEDFMSHEVYMRGIKQSQQAPLSAAEEDNIMDQYEQ